MTEKEFALYLARQQRNSSYVLMGLGCFMLVMTVAGLCFGWLPAVDAGCLASPIISSFCFGYLLHIMARVGCVKARKMPDDDQVTGDK